MSLSPESENSSAPLSPAPKYWAFISYSHRDARWAEWLHRSLETYRVPARLVGREARDGEVPARLFPFFRDRDELPTSSNLGDNLHEALRQSRYLIVICSPAAATSRWVNEEVRLFKALGREDRILCLIVAGEPHAADKLDCGNEECFPPTVRFRVGRDGRISDQPVEPIAADVRAGRDSKPDAKLKLLAGLLGVGFDELKQRDRRRALRERVEWTALAASLLLSVLGICGWQLHLRQELARREQIASLTESGRRELLEGRPRESAVYLSEAYRLGGNDLPLRLMLSRVLPPLETEVATLRGHTSAVNFAVYSPDGSRILTGSDDGLAKVWNANTHELVTTLSGHKWFVRSGGFAADGRTVFTVGSEEVVQLSSAETGQLIATVAGERATLNREGNLLVMTRDGRARVYDATSGKLLQNLETPEPTSPAQLSPSGQWRLTTSENVATLWEVARPEMPVVQLVHPAWVQYARFSPDGRRILTAANDETVYLWDAATGQQLLALRGHTGAIQSAEFSPGGQFAVTASSDRTVKLWDLRRLPVQATFTVDRASAIAFHPAKMRLACAGARVEIWDVPTGRRINTIDAHPAWGVRDVAFSPDGSRLVTASEDRTCKVWELSTGKLVTTFGGHQARVLSARFSPDGRHVVSAGLDHAAKIWDAASGQLVRSLPLGTAQPSWAGFTPGGERVVIAAGRSAGIWNVATGKLVLNLAEQATGPSHAAISPSGARIVTTDGEHANLWDAATGNRVARLSGHLAHINCAAFSPDGALIATAAGDGTLRIWDAESARQLLRIDGPAAEMHAVEFSPDGQSLAFASFNGSVQVRSFPQESRQPEAVSELVRREVPLDVLQGRLVPR